MSTSVGGSSCSNFVSYPGECSALPPKSPFLNSSPFIHDVTRGVVKPGDGYVHHQRNFSESLIFEEQPSWLDDLLNEPDSPVHLGSHRRSSSDSFTYVNAPNYATRYFSVQDEYRTKNMASDPKMSYWEFRNCNNVHRSSTKVVPRGFLNEHHSSSANGIPYIMDNIVRQTSGPPGTAQEEEYMSAAVPEKLIQSSQEDKSTTIVRPSASEEETKHARQLLAQRSRVRKLQYIAELERVVQTLLVEGCDLSASLEFLNHQNIILNMENTALKQRLDSLSHEQMIKCFEHQVLEKEIARLRVTYHHQKLQQQVAPRH